MADKHKPPGHITQGVSLSPFTAYGTGGDARYFTAPRDLSELTASLTWAHEAGITIILVGEGNNLLVSDAGLNGLVVKLGKDLSGVKVEGGLVRALAGTPLSDLVSLVNRMGYGGMEKLAGIPGTVGGAVAMNAGAFGQEIKDHLNRVRIMNRTGDLEYRACSELNMGYRTSIIREQALIVVEAEFQFDKSCNRPAEELERKSSETRKRRAQKQPLDKKNCGSVFKRPPGHYAGTLVEECGLKGFRMGDAEVSAKHANFIVNRGNATSMDIYQVIRHVQQTVLEHKGVELELEVVLVGDF